MYTLVLIGEQQYQFYSLWFDPTIAPIHHLPHSRLAKQLQQWRGCNEYEIVIFLTGHSVWWTKMIHQTESTFTRPKENRNFLNISLLMVGLYSFLYLYKAFFIVIDFN